MYLFTRRRTAEGTRFRKALSWAIETKEMAADKTGFDISLYASVFGRPTGTLIWATMVESRAAYSHAMTSLLGDDEYWDIIEGADGLFVGETHDELRQVVQLDGIDLDGDAPNFAQGWTAQIQNGQLDHAMDWGTDIATYVHELTGSPMATFADAYGGFATMSWIATFDDAEAVDRSAELLGQDPEWVKRVNYAEDLFIPGSGQVWLDRRLA